MLVTAAAKTDVTASFTSKQLLLWGCSVIAEAKQHVVAVVMLEQKTAPPIHGIRTFLDSRRSAGKCEQFWNSHQRHLSAG